MKPALRNGMIFGGIALAVLAVWVLSDRDAPSPVPPAQDTQQAADAARKNQEQTDPALVSEGDKPSATTPAEARASNDVTDGDGDTASAKETAGPNAADQDETVTETNAAATADVRKAQAEDPDGTRQADAADATKPGATDPAADAGDAENGRAQVDAAAVEATDPQDADPARAADTADPVETAANPDPTAPKVSDANDATVTADQGEPAPVVAAGEDAAAAQTGGGDRAATPGNPAPAPAGGDAAAAVQAGGGDRVATPKMPAPAAAGDGASVAVVAGLGDQEAAGPAVREDRVIRTVTRRRTVEAPTDPDAPAFDIVRVEADGQAVVAGKAKPGETVDILLDGKVVETVTADSAGKFVAIIFATLTGDAQSLQLRVAAPEADPVDAMAAAPQAPAAPKPVPDGIQPKAMDATRGTATPDDLAATDGADAQNPPQPALSAQEPDIRVPAGDGQLPAAVTPVFDTRPVIVLTDTSAQLAAAKAPAQAQVSAQPVVAAPRAPQAAPQGRYKLSAPVIIIPNAQPDAAPALVQPQPKDLALLQAPAAQVDRVVLDRITYSDVGDVQLQGRGRAGRAVRIYGNGLIVGTTMVAQDGTWTIALARDRGQRIELFRFDEVAPGGSVESRIETPFKYSVLSPQVVQERRVVVQKGDVLWRIAEQYYGEGIRYSVIFGANDTLIRDPDLIYPGQVFSIPELVDAN